MKLMSLRNRFDVDRSSSEEGIVLWEPIAASRHSKLGLYNDDRFPGRSILASLTAVQQLEELPMAQMMGFMRDVQICCQAIKRATQCSRVNVCFLGNKDPFLHAHLVPRFPWREDHPDRSPWDDPRPKGKLSSEEVERIKVAIWESILLLDSRDDSDAYSNMGDQLF